MTGEQVGDNKIVFLGMPMTQRTNDERSYEVLLGTLGQAVLDAQGMTAAVGNSDVGYVTGEQRKVRPAALAAMSRDGLVGLGEVSPKLLQEDAHAPFGIETDLKAFARALRRVRAELPEGQAGADRARRRRHVSRDAVPQSGHRRHPGRATPARTRDARRDGPLGDRGVQGRDDPGGLAVDGRRHAGRSRGARPDHRERPGLLRLPHLEFHPAHRDRHEPRRDRHDAVGARHRATGSGPGKPDELG